MYKDPKYERSYNGIANVTEAFFLMDLNDIEANHEFIANHPNGTLGSWAVVCSEPLQNALAALYQRTSEGTHRTKVFSSFEAAEEWVSRI